MRKRFNAQGGFTLFEVITVLLILGILSAIVINRWTNLDVEVYTGMDALKTHLRYAQTQAMNRDPNSSGNTVMGITYDSSANQYWLFRGTNTSDILLLPDDAQFATADRKINLNLKKIKLTGNFPIYFDDRGIPYSSYPNTPLASAQTISVSGISGSPSLNVTITSRTGFVP